MKNKNRKILVLALTGILSGSGALPALAEGEPAPAAVETDISEEAGIAAASSAGETSPGQEDYEDPSLYEDPAVQQANYEDPSLYEDPVVQQEEASAAQAAEDPSSETEYALSETENSSPAEKTESLPPQEEESIVSEEEAPAETAVSGGETETESLSSAETDALLPLPVPDPETREAWEQTFRDVKFTGKFAEDLLAIALTQLGYSQSSTDYILDQDGQPLWYSRYAAWEGLDYGAWNAMFTDFCLYYAGIPFEILPSDLEFRVWIEKLEDLYTEADGTYQPCAGDLIFMRQPEEESGEAAEEEVLQEQPQDPDAAEQVPDRCGIVSAVDEDRIFVIEGDCLGQVLECGYERGDERILGYVSMEAVQKRAEEKEKSAEEAQPAKDTKDPDTAEDKKEEKDKEDKKDGKRDTDPAPADEDKPESPLLYDTNQSGQVDINDAQYLYYQVTAAMEDADAVGDLTAFDFNGDGITDLADVRFLSHILSDPEQAGALRDPAEETESTAVQEEKR